MARWCSVEWWRTWHGQPPSHTCVDFHVGAFQRPCSVHFLLWPSIWTAWVWSLQRQRRQRLTQASEETEALVGHINTLEVGGWQCVSHSESFGWLPCCPAEFSSTQTHLCSRNVTSWFRWHSSRVINTPGIGFTLLIQADLGKGSENSNFPQIGQERTFF